MSPSLHHATIFFLVEIRVQVSRGSQAARRGPSSTFSHTPLHMPSCYPDPILSLPVWSLHLSQGSSSWGAWQGQLWNDHGESITLLSWRNLFSQNQIPYLYSHSTALLLEAVLCCVGQEQGTGNFSGGFTPNKMSCPSSFEGVGGWYL